MNIQEGIGAFSGLAPQPATAILPARAQAADRPSSCSGPQLFTLFVHHGGGFSKPPTCFGGQGGWAAGGLRDSSHVGLFSPETQTDCSVAAGMEAAGLRAQAGLAPTAFASESRASDGQGTGC